MQMKFVPRPGTETRSLEKLALAAQEFYSRGLRVPLEIQVARLALMQRHAARQFSGLSDTRGV